MERDRLRKFGQLRWTLRLVVLSIGIGFGSSLGIATYTLYYAKGASYLTNDPRACVNCHIMTEQFEGWTKSSHRSVATCNDCHAPHTFLGKYLTKASNGFWHSYAFTTGNFHEPIQITARNKRITEGTCRYCHESIVSSIDSHGGQSELTELSCLHCHRSVGHAH